MYRPAVALFLAGTLLIAGTHYTGIYPQDTAPDRTELGQTRVPVLFILDALGSDAGLVNAIDDLYVAHSIRRALTLIDTKAVCWPRLLQAPQIWYQERIKVSWCLKSGHGTRVIPEGMITGARFLQTPEFVQITGTGDFTKLNVPLDDARGELDPNGSDLIVRVFVSLTLCDTDIILISEHPPGGLVFSSAFSSTGTQTQQSFMGSNEFCFKACGPAGKMAAGFCNEINSRIGCARNMPASGVFDSCNGDSGEPMGTATFQQGDASAPIPSSSQCTTVSSIGGATATISASVNSSHMLPIFLC
ncbi:uncharacterized protein ARMOST_19456 [Armillaria ostoyae]|uniref:Peptidase S1 domain-containing protein n=1 Tax=Armillaria ostoyae TaxID=47428 RepID=A0A284S4K3_ARMOS|nr:uncharacterized protein ARMOST_19456 [Armillaria ostoyae]